MNGKEWKICSESGHVCWLSVALRSRAACMDVLNEDMRVVYWNKEDGKNRRRW